ncbi:Adenylyl-sulfate kinase [Ensifer adhaerens]|nr:Adenylyl-sulfate kinase [Ensifer adhaerens]
MMDFPLDLKEHLSKASRRRKGILCRIYEPEASVPWFTGLSGAGKSTIANHLKKLLRDDGRQTILLDGDNIRHGLNSDLGFAEADRAENIRRIAEVAKLMTEAGLIVIVACISPFRSGRQFARDLMAPSELIEIFVDTPLKECIMRDPKDLYKWATSGEVHHFTGIDSPYEPPERPELHLRTTAADPAQLAQTVETFLRGKFY